MTARAEACVKDDEGPLPAGIARIEGVAAQRDAADQVRETFLTPGTAAAPDPELDIEAVSAVNPELAALLDRAKQIEAR